MKYFQLFVDENYIPPSPMDWYGKLDRRTMADKYFYDLPKQSLFVAEPNMQMMFTDIITFPCFLVSKTIMHTLNQYDSSITHIRIILYEQERKQSKIYYLPFLYEIETQSSQRGAFKETLVVEHGLLRDRAIFKANNCGTSRIFVRLDLLESILRRDAVGIGVREVELIDSVCH